MEGRDPKDFWRWHPNQRVSFYKGELMKKITILALLWALWGTVAHADPSSDIPAVTPISDSLRTECGLDPFYQKVTHAGPLLVLGSHRVSDAALCEAVWIVQHEVAHRPEILQALADKGVRLAVMAHDEYTTDIPEYAHLKPKEYWDRRARGLGGQLISGAEENLLAFPGDPYRSENILIHEFAHVIQGFAMDTVDPNFNPRLKAVYQQACEQGLWEGTYAGSNVEEYWAEAVQDWFDNNRQNDGIHNHVNTRVELKEYDPNLAALCAEVLGEGDWRYQKPAERNAAGRAHLGDYDFSKVPRFQWRAERQAALPRVRIRTSQGDMVAELYPNRAPTTVVNFLRYVDSGFFTHGRFFRTVTLDNQPNDKVKIEVIQAECDPNREDQCFAPIGLERTRDTGVQHLDGTLSMARAESDTAQHSFSICINPQPALDFGGGRQPDGQGFAAFGRVIEGMDMARQIQALPAQGQQLTPAVEILEILRLP